MKLPVFFTIAMALMGMQRTAAQTDPHFTQNYTYPTYINPAMVGQGDGDIRTSAIYRSQWGSVGNPYRTTGLAADTRTGHNIALGLNLLDQSAGDAGFNYLSAAASFAYTGVRFGKDENHHVILAIQAGILNRSVDETKFKWGDQWNPITGYNAYNPTAETFARSAATTFDAGAGALYYDGTPDKKYNLFGGVAFYHINKPADPIVYNHTAEMSTIPVRFVAHGGASINLADGASIVPHFLYNQQGNAREVIIGTYFQKNVNAEATIMAGAYYRHKDAIAPYFGVDYKSLLIGVSYDVNTSMLGTTAGNVHSFELTFSYVIRKETRGVVDFIHCPRL